jgi:hypothetical protein
MSKSIFLFIFLYFYIFQPPFITRLEYLIIEVVFFFLLITQHSEKIFRLFYFFKREFVVLVLIFIYSFSRDLIANDIIYVHRSFSILFQCFIFPLSMIAVFTSHHDEYLNLEKRKHLLLLVILIAGVTPLMMMMFPSIHDVYTSLIVNDNESVRERFMRGIGMSENLTFSFAYVLACALAYLLHKSMKLEYIVISLVLIFGISLNARIGFVPVLMVLLYNFFKKIKSSVFVVGMLFIVGLLILKNVEFDSKTEISLLWVGSFFTDIFHAFTGNTSNVGEHSSLRALFTDHIIIPNDAVNIIFGDGVNLFESSHNSDMGFITQLNYGGLFFLLLLLSLFMLFIIRLKVTAQLNTVWVMFFSISLIVLNLKGSVYSSIPITRLFALIYLYYIYVVYLKFESENVDKEIYNRTY